MATRHHRTSTTSPLRRVRMTLASTALLTAALLAAPAAGAAPADDARVDQARSQHDAVAAEVAAIGARVTESQDALERMSTEAEAAAGDALVAQAALDVANQQASDAADALVRAGEAVTAATDDVADIGRQAYMGGGTQTFGDMQLLLAADGPGQVLQRAATLDVLGVERAKTLRAFEAVEAEQARAEAAARAAAAERDTAARTAVDAKNAADAQLAGAQAQFDAIAADKAALDRQLRDAEIRLLEMQGARDAAAAWEAQQAARQAAVASSSAVSATGGGVAPATGRVSSCYGSRWGTLHAGVDIAAPIGTPIYAPEGGVVLQAGPSSGFGLAVAVRHGDGTITLYGHVNQMFVSAGQVVTAGERIAEVGNRGQSTGPHLHFEVHTGGLYADRTDPMPWLTAHGISLGGC